MRARLAYLVPLICGVAILVLVALALFAHALDTQKIKDIEPSLGISREKLLDDVGEQEQGRLSDERFAIVDWDYWQAVNPDMVGWLSIPDTPIDYPIVQAPTDDPDFYLTHDVYRDRNVCGCPYLDADAQGGLFGADNASIAGHHWFDGTLFACISDYIDKDFADEHPYIYVQTKDSWRVYEVAFASTLSAKDEGICTNFKDEGELETYFNERKSGADMVRKDVPAQPFLSLYTCSYYRFADERTVVYAVPIEIDGRPYCHGDETDATEPFDRAVVEDKGFQ